MTAKRESSLTGKKLAASFSLQHGWLGNTCGNALV